MARSVARDWWDSNDPLELSAFPGGKSRRTWRVGQRAWLTASLDADELEREQLLLIALAAQLERSTSDCQVPAPIPSTAGKLVVATDGLSWRMTRHLTGARPDDNRLETHLVSARCLNSIHRLLQGMSPTFAVERRTRARLSDLVDESLDASWTSVTADKGERQAVIEMAAWLRPRLGVLDDVPHQLVHGDWSTPNLLVSRSEPTRVVGVLDWQLASVGTPLDDLAAIASTILMWSTIADKRGGIRAVIDSYGAEGDLRAVGVAMGAYWLRNYWRGRDELRREELMRPMLERQPDRLRSVLSFVSGL